MAESSSKYTGGQYSLLRLVLGLSVSLWLQLSEVDASLPVLVAGHLTALLIVVGAWDRIAAVVGAVLTIVLSVQAGTDPGYAPVVLCVLLLLHAMVPPAPFGSWAARGRSDPGGGWTMPGRNRRQLWIVLSVAYAYLGILELNDSLNKWPIATALIAFGPFALVARVRATVWTVFFVGHLVAIMLLPELAAKGSWLLFHLFAFDPAWVRPVQRDETTTVFFDGTCGLCHRTTRFLIAEDVYDNLRFAPLQGSTFEAQRGERDASTFPDSLIVFAPDGRILVRSGAVLEALTRLGGLWRVLAGVARLVPRWLRDLAYDFVAANRRRLFTQPEQLCPLVPAHLAQRFLP